MSLDVTLLGEDSEELYWANITHNLGSMADAAGIYYALWRPEEKGYKIARDIIEPLTKGLEHLKRQPEEFKKYNADNGWGLYKNFVPFVEKYLEACNDYPNATISVSR